MTYKLFLDDVRSPPDESWIVARTYEEAIETVNAKGFPTTLSFDHDLGDDVHTGKDFANWLIERDLSENDMPEDFSYAVHSANPPGAANIRGILDGYLKFKDIAERM